MDQSWTTGRDAVRRLAITLFISGLSLSLCACSSAPKVVDFRASPTEIILGESTLLMWVVQDANEVTIDPDIGIAESVGHLEVSPIVSTTYTITARSGSHAVSASVIVEVLDSAQPQDDSEAGPPQSAVDPTESVIEIGLVADAFGAAVQVEYDADIVPWLKASGDHVVLVNNRRARNPSYSELQLFIKVDDNNLHSFVPGEYTGLDFAESLHNAAEQWGYRAALAIVTLGDDSAPYALNVFNTSDSGIVFVDCTGLKPEDPLHAGETCDADTIAYVRVDKPLGLVHVAHADRPDYSFYEEHKAKISNLGGLIDEYEMLYAEYEQKRQGRTEVPPNEYGELHAMETELHYSLADILSIELAIGSCRWKEIGSPSTLQVWW